MAHEDWLENKKLVLAELQRLSRGQERTLDKLNNIEAQLAGMRVKVGLMAGFFGVVGGVLVALGSVLVK